MSSTQFLMVNPYYDMSGSFTDASTNIDYQANASRNFINLIGDISNVDVSNTLYEGKTYDPSLSLVQFVKKTKTNFLDSNVNTILDNLLYWARNTSGLNKFPILETGASGESNNEQPIDLTIPIYKLDNIFVEGSTGPTYPIATNAISSWNGFSPDKDWSIKMSVHNTNNGSHNTLWKFAYANGYASLRRFDGWGLVFVWASDSVNMSGVNPLNNHITIAYKPSNNKTSGFKYFDFAIAYNSVNYSHDGGGTTPDIADIAFFMKEAGGSWVEIPKTAYNSMTNDTMFLYYHGDDLDESHDFTWSSSENMTAEFGGEHHQLPATSSSNNITMSGLKLWNMPVTVSELTDN